jgi:hypothetical protein
VGLGEGRYALYRTAIETLREDASLSEQYKHLCSVMEILSKMLNNDRAVKLVTLREILSRVLPLLQSDNEKYQEMARELVARFTTCE